MNRRPGKGKPFVKGDKRCGRPRKTPEEKKAYSMNKTEATQILVDFMQMKTSELELIPKDKSRKVIEHIIARIALEAIRTGDHVRLNFVLDRVIGKVSDKIEHSVRPKVVHNLDGGAAQFLLEGEDE